MSVRAGATVTAATLVALSAIGGGAAVAAPQAGGQATVSVLHAVPGLTVDVYAGGKELIPNFKPGTLTDPVMLNAGSYDIKIFKDGAGPGGIPAIEKTVDVPPVRTPRWSRTCRKPAGRSWTRSSTTSRRFRRAGPV